MLFLFFSQSFAGGFWKRKNDEEQQFQSIWKIRGNSFRRQGYFYYSPFAVFLCRLKKFTVYNSAVQSAAHFINVGWTALVYNYDYGWITLQHHHRIRYHH